MEPCDLPATEARRLIGAKQLSPVELTTSCIARTEAVDHAVNAMPTRGFERALEVARAQEAAVMRGDELGALHGLPIAIKDTNEAAGLRFTSGSPIFADRVPSSDERFVALLRAAGGNIVGKTNVPDGPRARIRAIPCSARPAIPSTRRARLPVLRAARRSRSPAGWCRSPRAPIRAARCAIRRPSAASWVSGRPPASSRARSAVPPGSRSPRSARWRERSPIRP